MSTRRPNVPRAARTARSTSSGQTGGSGAADGTSDPSAPRGGHGQSRAQRRVETGDGVISAEVLHPDFGSNGKDTAGAGEQGQEAQPESAAPPESAAQPKGAAGPVAAKPRAKSRLSAAARRASERDSAKFAVREPVVSWNRQEPGSGTAQGNGTSSGGASEPVPAKSFSGRLLALAVVLVAMIVILAPTVQTYVEQRMEINALQQDIAAQQQEKERLTTQLSRWEDPAYIKQQARKRLFLVMPGETRYLVVGADEAKEPEQIPASPTGDEEVPWVDALFESIKRSATD